MSIYINQYTRLYSNANTYTVVFSENITGDGASTSFQLKGALNNASFTIGSWNSNQILKSFPTAIKDVNDGTLYDDTSLFGLLTRHTIAITSISGNGVINLNYPPENNAIGKVYYWYSIQPNDRIDNYVRNSVVSTLETQRVDLSSSVATSVVNFNGILNTFDDNVQKALDKIDDVAISKVETANVSAYLQTQINNISVSQGTSGFATITSVSNLSADYYTFKSQQTTLNSNVQSTLSQLSSVTGSGNSGSYTTQINELSGNVNYISSNILQITASNSVLNTKINSLSASSSILSTQISNISSNNILISTSVVNLSGYVVNLATLTNTISASYDSRILNISGQQNSQNTIISQLISLTGSLQTQAITNATNIASISGNQNNYALTSTVTSLTGSLQSQITTVNNSLTSYTLTSTLSSISASLQTQATTNATNIASISGNQNSQNIIISQLISLTGALQSQKISDAPSDSNNYVRKNGNWQILSISGSNSGSVNLTSSDSTLTITGNTSAYDLKVNTNSLTGTFKTLNGTGKTLSYDLSGNLSVLSDVRGVKTFNYVNGVLTSISGSGSYRTKSFVYDLSGNLVTINIL